MVKALIGRKLGMTQVFADDGSVVPVTVIQAGPCVVTQVKVPERDGYSALQLGFGTKSEKKVNRPMKGHLDKVGKGYFQALREVRVDNVDEFEMGQVIGTDVFEIGDRVDVTGISKGKGFAGTIKRWGFSRGPETHGCKNIREPGSTGCATFPGRVIKGKKMAGQKGNKRVTTLNLKIVDVRPEENLLLIKGAVPGAKNGLVFIRKTNRVK
ncbi:LSU ribosomal protein L3P [Desulfacinum infernum DSM 9756]|jgi:large subunit ribosomal protein L3|uniref:Large ribosomal subunit protein uL3 n=1 Tax=Desulfacinum infernum DSM 9756 TaxID=1121391 RepID=A0A1M4VWK8_9BACT|nr:50S ribosomal protein L3 [Desulfacinum sp.]MBZ4658691.1 ribosomal protein [Desulfacinum sp.]SHE73358.1 LSU ribosomal protein L3P [Desulfacinum infernum DSM 9756]